MKRLPIALLLVLVASLVHAQDAERQKRLDAFVARSKTEKAQAIKRFSQRLTEAKTELSKIQRAKIIPSPLSDGKSRTFGTKEDKLLAIKAQNDAIETLRLEKAEFEKPGFVYVPGMPNRDLKLGDMGMFPIGVVSVQIIDDENMLIEHRWDTVGTKQFSRGTRHTQTLWAKGFSTKGLVDDAAMLRDVCVEVTGTTKYDTPDGATRTVLVIEPLDLEKHANK
jgi:hypothetical protein